MTAPREQWIRRLAWAADHASGLDWGADDAPEGLAEEVEEAQRETEADARRAVERFRAGDAVGAWRTARKLQETVAAYEPFAPELVWDYLLVVAVLALAEAVDGGSVELNAADAELLEDDLSDYGGEEGREQLAAVDRCLAQGSDGWLPAG